MTKAVGKKKPGQEVNLDRAFMVFIQNPIKGFERFAPSWGKRNGTSGMGWWKSYLGGLFKKLSAGRAKHFVGANGFRG